MRPLTTTELNQYHAMFGKLAGGAPVTRGQANSVFRMAKLPEDEIDLIWCLCDRDMDGLLTADEFCIALHVAAQRYKGAPHSIA